MRDIKITLSQESERAPSIEAEAEWMEEEGELWYPLGKNRPLDAGEGSWVYFVRAGRVVGRARAVEFRDFSRTPSHTYSGEDSQLSGWRVCCNEIEIANPGKRPKHRGFQGFRYVTDDEADSFEQAFD